ncbi:MAG: glycosyl hydrolase family 28-related protein [Gemmatimonadales bacterium]|nr:glycosyl hydrolase family 28-related protein [Gemmatimonadales bacterium]
MLGLLLPSQAVAPYPVLDAARPPFAAAADGRRDAAPALQAALDSAARLGGAEVRVPAGQYRIGATLVLRGHGIRLVGAGAGRTVLRADPALEGPVLLAAGADRHRRVRDVRVEALTADGTGARKRGRTVVVFLQRVEDARVVGVEALASSDIGIGVGDGEPGSASSARVAIIGCVAHDNAGNGFDAANVEDVTFIGNVARRNGGVTRPAAGFFSGHGRTSRVRWIGNVAEANTGVAFHASSGRPDAADQFTRDLEWTGNAARGTVAATGWPGAALLLNRGGPGPTRMDGRYRLVGNRASGNHVDGGRFDGGVAAPEREGDAFGAPARPRGLTGSPRAP